MSKSQWLGPYGSFGFQTGSYNRSQALYYASLYWKYYNNTKWPSFTGEGEGDCANFVSQCLNYGGYDMKYAYTPEDGFVCNNYYTEWWCDTVQNGQWSGLKSRTWAGSHSLRLHLKRNHGTPRFESVTEFPLTSGTQWKSLQRGDLLFHVYNHNGDPTDRRADHVSIISYVETRSSSPLIFVYSHTADKDGTQTVDGLWEGYHPDTVAMKLSDNIITSEYYNGSNRYDYGTSNVGRSSTANAYAMRVQARLYMQGVDPNGIDGIYGQDTVDAVTNFQILCGLPRTGIVDNATKRELAIDSWG